MEDYKVFHHMKLVEKNTPNFIFEIGYDKSLL